MKSHKLTLFGFLFLCISCTNESDEKMKVIHKDNPDFQTEEYRKIFLDGTHNTRELGGYKTTDGKKVKWGVLYRSDKLSDLSTDDQEYLSSLGIKNVIDFRSSNEKSEDPDLIPCLLYTSPSPRDATLSRMPSSA